MDDVIIISYASDEPYKSEAKNIKELADYAGIKFRLYNRNWLKKTKFHKDNLDLLSDKKSGFCAWKPYIILHSLKSYKKVLYLDSSMLFPPHKIKEYIDLENEPITSTITELKNKFYTRKKTFQIMQCNHRHYRESYQPWAGNLLVNQSAKDIVVEWLYYCSIRDCICDDVDLNNDAGFKYHLYDQSILGILFKKYDLKFVSNFLPFMDTRELMHKDCIEKMFGKDVILNQLKLSNLYSETYQHNSSVYYQ